MQLPKSRAAAESGATRQELDRFIEAGIIRPADDGTLTWAELQRVRAVKQFLDAGVGWEHMRRAVDEGLITFDYADAFYLEPAGPSGRTYREYRDSLGPNAQHLSRVYDTLGLAEPPPDRPMREDEEGCLAELVDLWMRVGEQEALLRATRLLGDHMRAMVEGWMALWTEHMRYVGVDAESLQQRADFTLVLGRGLTGLLPRIMVWAEQRYLERAMTAVGVEQMEEVMAAHGIAPAPPEHPPAVLFVDLAGFSRLTEQHGDEAAVLYGTRLRDVAERAARGHRGKLVKLLGDGAMLHFEAPQDAVGAGRQLLSTEGWDADLPDPHIGAHAGPVIERDGDLFGTTVNIAARLSSSAGAGEFIVSSDVVAGLTQPDEIALRPMGELILKNIDRSISAFSVVAR
ncbi:MAG TPA: adenylate/guanylate cyclase domain-containing protein [Candidatus Limnocylindria bacterium]|nr:adenylate/guanylate cyclase domain-containing protein [Candidatus Limnocylindria bacterium]